MVTKNLAIAATEYEKKLLLENRDLRVKILDLEAKITMKDLKIEMYKSSLSAIAVAVESERDQFVCNASVVCAGRNEFETENRRCYLESGHFGAHAV